jgi:K+-sensing histidine kinase KdpD
MANLLRESIACARPSSEINITARRVGGGQGLMVVIKDNGFGVFDRHPVDTNANYMVSPLMLEFKVLQNLVRSFHGSLEAKCIIGKGKTMTLKLPNEEINKILASSGNVVLFKRK